MRGRLMPLSIAIAIVIGCAEPWPRPPAITQDQYVREFQEWRDDRRSRLVAPGSGPVTWIGLLEIQPNGVAIGGDASLPIALPASQAGGRVGVIQREGHGARFTPAPGVPISLVDSARTPVTAALTLASDRTPTPTVLALGSLRLRVHGEPGTDRLWLRVWDEEHPARATFTLPDAYPLDTTWRIAARFEAFDAPREFPVVDVTDGTQAFRSPGALVFRARGAEHRLIAFADTNSETFFVMLWDSTALTDTYQAGRYMRVPLPDSTGWTVIDFNRTYNPPCVFTPYSTCAFPPRENRLSLRVQAGEKRVR